MRALVDTNVFLDVILNRPGFYENSHEFFDYMLSHRHQLVVSPMSFRDIDYVLRKVESNVHERREILHKIYSMAYKIIDLAPDDVINAIFEDQYKDFEDGLLIESSERKMLDGIVTNNKKDFAYSHVPVFSPEEIVRYLKTNDGETVTARRD